MGKYTVNSTFYKPALGELGQSACDKFNDALDVADEKIQDITTKINNGVVPRMTTTEIQTVADAGDASTVRIIFNTTRNALEIWVGHDFARPL